MPVPNLNPISFARGILAIPEGYEQNGISGALSAYQTPVPYEQSARQQKMIESAQPQIENMFQQMDLAKQSGNPAALAPVIRDYQRLQFEIMQSGATDEATFNRIMGPVQDRLSREMNLMAGLQQDPEGMVRAGVAGGSPLGVQGGGAVQRIRTGKQVERRAEEMHDPRKRGAESQADYYDARADYWKSKAGRGEPLNGGIFPAGSKEYNSAATRERMARKEYFEAKKEFDESEGLISPERFQEAMRAWNRERDMIGLPTLGASGMGLHKVDPKNPPLAGGLLTEGGPAYGADQEAPAPMQIDKPEKIEVPDAVLAKGKRSEIYKYLLQQGLSDEEAQAQSKEWVSQASSE